MRYHELSVMLRKQFFTDCLQHDIGWLRDNLDIQVAARWNGLKQKWFRIFPKVVQVGSFGVRIAADFEAQAQCTLTRAKFEMLWRNQVILLDDQTMSVELEPGKKYGVTLEKSSP